MSSPNLSKIATVFGLVWVGLVIASGMIANIGLSSVVKLGVNEPDQAMLIWSSIGIVTEGLGGGNEIVGGFWVLLLSFAAWQGKSLSKALIWLGIAVGVAGVLTIYPADVFADIFGVSQMIWFLWIGIFMILKPVKRIDA